MSANLNFESFAGISGRDSWRTARQLASARRADHDILIDLPYAAHYYRHTLSAHRRLGSIASRVQERELVAEVILVDGRAVGVGSAVPVEFPGSDHDLASAGIDPSLPLTAVEIDYWHANLAQIPDTVISLATTGKLLSESLGLIGDQGGDMALAWQAVPMSNTVEGYACMANDMVRVGEPGVIDIGDGVDLYRQIWAKPIATLG